MNTAYSVFLTGFNDWDNVYVILKGVFSSKKDALTVAEKEFQEVAKYYQDNNIPCVAIDKKTLSIVVRDDDTRISYDWKVTESIVDDPGDSEEICRFAI